MPVIFSKDPKPPTLLGEISTEQRGVFQRMGDFFFKAKPTNLLQSPTRKDNVCDVAPLIKVEMDCLLDFLRMDIESAVRPNIKLSYLIDDEEWNERWDENCLKALVYFLDSLQYVDFFLQAKENAASKEKCADFVGFCKKGIELFEEFFPLPQKHKLFAEELIEAIYKHENIDTKDKDNFILKYDIFIGSLKMLCCPQYHMIADGPNKLEAFNNLLLSFMGNINSRPERVKICKSFGEKLLKLLEKIKSKSIKEDTQNIKDKIKAVAESTFNESSIFDKKSFLDAMQREAIELRHSELTKLEMKEIRKIWIKIKEHITDNDIITEVSSISVNDRDIPKQYMSAAVEFLGSIVGEKRQISLGEWDSTKLPSEPEIRQGLVITAMTGLLLFGFHENWFVVKHDSFLSVLGKLTHSFSELTKQEKIAIMCAEVELKGKLFPLLPLLFLNSEENISQLIKIVEDFMPEVFDIRFQVNEEEKRLDIIELLKEIEDFYNKKKTDENMGEAEKNEHCFLLTSLKELIEGLEYAKNQIQKKQELTKNPDTLVHQTEEDLPQGFSTEASFYCR